MAGLDRQALIELASQARRYAAYLGGLGYDSAPTVAPYKLEQPKPLQDAPDTLAAIEQSLAVCPERPTGQCGQAGPLGQGQESRPQIMFIGLSPVAGEGGESQLFAEAEATLLTNIIKGGLKLALADCYLTTARKCPPLDESALIQPPSLCVSLLSRQIALIQPRIICCLGKDTALALLDEPGSLVRGRFYEFAGIPLIYTHDLTSLGAFPELKRETFEDVKQMISYLASDR